MDKENAIKLFSEKQVRCQWDSETEKWYFSIIDIIEILTESTDAGAYWRKLKERLKKEGNETMTNCHTLKMLAADGKMRQTDVADTETRTSKTLRVFKTLRVLNRILPQYSNCVTAGNTINMVAFH